jgi:multifunctional methyltransferase subunit TRM112
MCHVRGCDSNNFPLKIEEAEVETTEAEYNEGFMRRLLTKLEWNALVQTAFAVSWGQ